MIKVLITLTRIVINQPLWTFGFAGGSILNVISHYEKEYLDLFGITGI
jgi:hypothetical protein